MATVLDLHTHSVHSSDAAAEWASGYVRPADIVASAKADNPAVAQLALTDHNTFTGCEEFMEACGRNGVEGFVSAEISGSHPDVPGTEFHFLTTFSNRWDPGIRRRIEWFCPYLNSLSRVDTHNVFAFLAAAATQDIRISYRRLVKHASALYREMDEPKNPDMIGPPGFHALRAVMRDMGIDEQAGMSIAEIEKHVWRAAGTRPLPTPPITEAYPAFAKARPAVTLAHPMNYGMSPEQLRPYVTEWQREIGLIAIGAHYKGVLHPEWKALADELGLLVSAGSDAHRGYLRDESGPHVPVVQDHEADIPALLAALRAAGR